jgi:hypothetical protein
MARSFSPASVNGYANSAALAMGKFALRGMARELRPQGIHIAHFVIYNAIRAAPSEPADTPDSMLDPDAIARSCLISTGFGRAAWASAGALGCATICAAEQTSTNRSKDDRSTRWASTNGAGHTFARRADCAVKTLAGRR